MSLLLLFPWSAAAQQVTPAGVPSGTGVPVGPRITQTGGPASPDWAPRITAALYTRAGALVADLPDSYNRAWQDRHDDPGTGSLSLQYDDPAAALADYGQVLRFSVDGTACYACLVERVRTVLAGADTAESAVELSGRGLLAMWEEAVVEPVGGASADILTDTVAYNFAHPDYDYSSWPPAVETPFAGMNYPPDWPDPLAHRIWDRDSRVIGVPAGDCYFRDEFTLGADATVEFWAQADDDFEFWLDGAVLLSGSLTEGVTQPANTRVNLASGVHHVGMWVRNLNALLGSAIATAFTVDSDGTPTGNVTRTDSSWRILAYPPVVPGFTVGRIVRLQHAAAQARGALADVSLAFDDFSDSSGQPWPVTADVSVQVGDDLLTVLLQLAESYADFHMGVQPVLYAYVSRGSTRAVAFSVGTNLSELVHDGSV